MNKQAPEKTLQDILSSMDTGTNNDKLRLFLLHYILHETGKQASDETKRLLKLLENAQIEQSAVKYVRQWKQFAQMFSDDQYTGGGTKAVDMFSRLLNQSSQLVMEGAQAFLLASLGSFYF